MEDVFRLTSCSVVRGFRGIRILGSAPSGGGRGNRDGLGRSPRSLRHLFATYCARDCCGICLDRLGLPVSHSGNDLIKGTRPGLCIVRSHSLFFFLRPLRHARFCSHRQTLARTRPPPWEKRRRWRWSARRRRPRRRRASRPAGADLRRDPACRRAGSRATGSARQLVKQILTTWPTED